MSNVFTDIVDSISYAIDEIPRWAWVGGSAALVILFLFTNAGKKTAKTTAHHAGKVAVWGAKESGRLGVKAAETWIERRVGASPWPKGERVTGTPVSYREGEPTEGEYRTMSGTKAVGFPTNIPEGSTWAGIKSSQRPTMKKAPMGFDTKSTRSKGIGVEGTAARFDLNPRGRRHYKIIHYRP